MKTQFFISLLAVSIFYSCSTINNDDIEEIIDQSSIQKTDISNTSSNLLGRSIIPLWVRVERWATGQGDYWGSQKWMAGDFNGDGKMDFAKTWNSDHKANIDVHLSTGSSFVMQRAATNQGGYWDSQKWMAGDFNGDGKTDLVKSYEFNGLSDIDVHLSNGNEFVMQRWANGQGGHWNSQKWMVGDFNGDKKDDLVKVWNSDGKADIDVHLSNGDKFTMQRWANGQGSFWQTQQWVVGDYNGDGKDDLAKIWNASGQANIDVHLSTGNTFIMHRWATFQGAYWDSQKWLSGDFNNDGYTDLAKIFKLQNGEAIIDVHFSNGNNEFTMQRLADKQKAFWDDQRWVTGDFDGDGRIDFGKAFYESFGRYSRASIDVHRVLSK